MKEIIEDLLGDPELTMAVRHAIVKRLTIINGVRSHLKYDYISMKTKRRLKEEHDILIGLLVKYGS